jgi:hypothetical protein
MSSTLVPQDIVSDDSARVMRERVVLWLQSARFGFQTSLSILLGGANPKLLLVGKSQSLKLEA